MEPLSALAIATLAFISTKASETIIEKFTEAALNKAQELHQKIWHKLQNQPEALKALEAAKENNSPKNLEIVADYLKIAMREDTDFKKEIEELAKEVKAGKKEDKNKNIQINTDNAKATQNNISGGRNIIAETVTINEPI